MTVHAVTYTYSDDTDARQEHRPAHRAFLAELARDGSLLLSGPFEGGTPGALLALQAADEDAVRALLLQDPFQQQGLVEHISVREWTPVLGDWLP